MKKITKNLMLVAASATALSAGAQDLTWEINRESVNFLGVQNSNGIIADFNNDGRLDIYYAGSAWNKYYDHPGIWPYQTSSNILYNLGDGKWEQDIITVIPTGEYELDENGEPILEKEKYQIGDSKHGILPVSNGHYATFDYNNDGLVDILAYGRKEGNDYHGFFDRAPENMRVNTSRFNDGGDTHDIQLQMVLYKNMGNGHFEIEQNFNVPIAVAEHDMNVKAMYYNNFAWGDYDHDGYVDIALCGTNTNPDEIEYGGRVTGIWRNIDGTGRFERMDIAETWGDAWKKEIKDEQDNIIVEAEKIPGGFLPISGNVSMADINNDGWLDLVFDGYCSNPGDGIYEKGSIGRVYLNQPDGKGGRKFVDITERSGAFNLTRGGNTQLVDLTGDGYLDILNTGYGDHNIGWKVFLYYNNLADDPETELEQIFNYAITMDAQGLPAEERAKLVVRDFNGDGILDVRFDNRQDGAVYLGGFDGNYTRSEIMPIRNNDSMDHLEIYGDVTGNGLVDRFLTGYLWYDDATRAEFNNGNDWGWTKWLFNNTTDAEIVAPAVPANVETSIDTDAKTLTITWEDVDADESPNCAYNVVVLTPSGKVIANIPVDPVTGVLKVAENKNIAIRPFVNKYTLPYNEVGEYKMGVQALSLNNEKASAIAWGQNLVAGVGNITTDLTDNDVKVTVNGNAIVANATANADVKVIDMMGRTIATGVTNTPINVEANGVLIVNVAGKSVKVVK